MLINDLEGDELNFWLLVALGKEAVDTGAEICFWNDGEYYQTFDITTEKAWMFDLMVEFKIDIIHIDSDSEGIVIEGWHPSFDGTTSAKTIQEVIAKIVIRLAFGDNINEDSDYVS